MKSFSLSAAFSKSAWAVLVVTSAVSSANAAGKVDVSFLSPDKYTDVGDGLRQEEGNLEQLGDYFKKTGEKRLAEGETLTLDFKDIDLAGRPKLMHRTSGDYRIMTGQADWPRIRLHWVLHTPGAADRSGDAAMADMNYLWRVPTWRASEPLYYEKRMIDAWFDDTFGAPVKTPAP